MGERKTEFMHLKAEGVRDGAKPISLLCLGPVKAFYDKPMLETEGWRNRENMDVVLGESQYPLGTYKRFSCL